MNDLDGITVVALEQAVAAPYVSGRLAEAGARVIKIERKEGIKKIVILLKQTNPLNVELPQTIAKK